MIEPGDFNESGVKRGQVGPGTAAKGQVVGSSQEFPALLREARGRQLQVDAERNWMTLEAAAQRTGINPRKLEEHIRAGRLLGAIDTHDPRQRLHVSGSSLRENLRALRHRTVE